jgi:hypothetical protein
MKLEELHQKSVLPVVSCRGHLHKLNSVLLRVMLAQAYPPATMNLRIKGLKEASSP